MKKSNKTINIATGVGIFSALAYITSLLLQFLPKVNSMLSFDVKDSVIAIASFIYGPVVAPVIALIAAFIEAITISETGWYGFIMNFASSATFSFVASIIYKYRKSFNGAIIGFCAAIVATTSVMLVLNIFVTPVYFTYIGIPMTTKDVIDLIPKVLLPFNFAKTLFNGAAALMLYKPIINALRAARIVPKSEHKTAFNKSSILALIIGGVSLILALTVLIIIW